MSYASHLLQSLALLAFSFLLVLANAFFVAAEFSIVKVRRTRLEELAGRGVKAARASIICVDQLDEYLSATQLGITVVSLALGWVGEESFAGLLVALFPKLFPAEGSTQHIVAGVLSFFLITLLHVVLGELVPKNMAIQNAEQITLRIARPLRLFYRVSRPLIHLFTLLANWVLCRLGYGDEDEPPLTEQELKIVMKESREEGVISESEAQIINRAFEFSDKPASQIMVPLDKVDSLSLNNPIEENLQIIKRNNHSRFPLFKANDESENSLDNLLGIVHIKDAWPLLLEDRSNSVFERCLRQAIFVDQGMRQDMIMKLFQGKRRHLAVVKNPSTQNIVGIVALEDVLESLVGEVLDEHGH